LYKVGIIGTGFGSKVYVPVMKSMNLFEITGLSDFGSGNSKKVIKKNNLSCQSFNDPKELIRSDKNNLICIVSPPVTHKNYIELSLQYKKHIICEKPIGLNNKLIKTFYKVAKRNNLLNIVNYHFRFNDLIMNLKKAIINSELGEIKEIKVNWILSSNVKKNNTWKSIEEKGGELKNEVLSHVIDYILFLIEEPITKIKNIKSRKYVDKLGIINELNRIHLLARCINCSINVYRCARFVGSHKILVKGSKKSVLVSFKSPFDRKSKSMTFFNERKLESKIIGSSSKDALAGDDRKNSFSNMLHQITNSINNDFLPTFDSAIKVWNILEMINKNLSPRNISQM
tara:strand:- start:62 stop:1087 length:1026 start_codon:yes stop_codon:yes gene_type:complete